MENIIDLRKTYSSSPLNPYWKKLLCAGRAAEGLRSGWQQQLERIQREIGFSHIRFHGIFHEDMMVCTRGADGSLSFNWHYVDDLFDFLLSVSIRPFVELGFMPYALASGDATCFRWKGNITPPKEMKEWEELVRAFTLHCIHRYGIDEIRTWYFEVWNEPNLYEYFWHGSQQEYFELYNATVRTLKSIDGRLLVGGPATSNFSHGEPPWIADFLTYCAKEELPVDFISSHPYPNHWPKDPISGKRKVAYRGEMATSEDTAYLRKLIGSSSYSTAQIHITEWNSSFVPWDMMHDTAFMGPFVVQNAIRSLGNVDSLGFWTFTDIFEETGAGLEVFHGGFGMFTYRGIPKPSYYAYLFLSKLKKQVLVISDSFIVTKEDDTYAILCWNYAHYKEGYVTHGQYDTPCENRYEVCIEKEDNIFTIVCNEQEYWDVHSATISPSHGSAYDVHKARGGNRYPSKEEYEQLIALSVPYETHYVTKDPIEVTCEAHAIVLIQMSKSNQREGSL